MSETREYEAAKGLAAIAFREEQEIVALQVDS